MKTAMKRLQPEKEILGAKLPGTYKDYVEKITQKHVNNNVDFGEKAVVINSFDGANHRSNTAGDFNICSYNTLVISEGMIEEMSSALSSGILTWRQIAAPESKETVLPEAKEIYTEMLIAKACSKDYINGCTYYFYDMHNCRCFTC